MLIWLQKWLCAITPFILSALTAMPVTAVIAVTAGTADGSPPTWRVAEKQTLFNGTAGDIMQPHNAHGGNFKTHARYEDGFLVVDVPEGANWGKVGLLSKKPAVWMDDFGHKAETRVVYTFDPKRTSGFGLALTLPGSGGVGGNDPSYPGVRYYWIRNAEGTAAKSELHIDPHRRDNYWHEETTPEAPQQVAVVLRPGSVAIELDGVEKVRRDWNVVGEGSGLHVYVFSHPPAAKIPVRMALKDISISRRFSTGTKGPTPVVQPLPPTVLFTGEATAAWEPMGVGGGNFDKFARYADGALVIAAPEGNSWAKTGLLSTEPVITLDRRLRFAPSRLILQLDPTRKNNLVTAFSTGKVTEMWKNHTAWFTFSYLPEDKQYIMGLHYSPYANWSRRIDSAWLSEHWDGRLFFDISDKWAAIRLPGGPSVRGAITHHMGQKLYATVIAHAPQHNLPAELVLRRIERSFADPPLQGPLDRWYMLDEEKFDPAGFIEDLAIEIPWIPQ